MFGWYSETDVCKDHKPPRLQTISEHLILEEQNGFRKSRSCTGDAFIMTRIIQKHCEFTKETHVAFVGVEKAFGRVDRRYAV